MDALMPERQTDDEILEECRKRFQEAHSAVEESYELMLDDLNFVNGDQWPSALMNERNADGRPCLIINKIASFGDQVIGDIRQNEPSIKIKPVDSGSDPAVAQILTGLIRNIEVQSNAEVAYDTAAESAVWCGKGTFRVLTEYTDDDTFEQDIRIKRVKNPFTVVWDPAAQEWDKSDAKYCFITERISRAEFDRMYPDKMTAEFFGVKDRDPRWGDDKSVRVAEYWRRVPETKNLYLLRNKETGEESVRDRKLPGWEVVKEREVESHRLEWYKTNGYELLEDMVEWPGKYIPIVEIYGKELNIEGKSIYRGIVRNAKDPQKLYNFSRSHAAEVTALAPKAPYIATARMIGNYQHIWDKAHKKSFPYLPYDADPTSPTLMPRRAEPIAQSSALVQEIMVSDQEIHDTTGLQQSNLGQKSNETSGRAILARQREGDTANFAFYDNLGRALTYTGKILLDLIPRIYDTARVLRIFKEDGSEDFVPVNQPVPIPTPDGRIIEKVFDLTVGKYDVVVTVGPSYATQRDEAVESMMKFLQVVPAAGPVIADLIAKSSDWPLSEDIAKRLKAMLPPGVAEGGAPTPPAPPPPDPNAMLESQRRQVEIEGGLLENRMKRHQVARMEMGMPETNEGKTTQ